MPNYRLFRSKDEAEDFGIKMLSDLKPFIDISDMLVEVTGHFRPKLYICVVRTRFQPLFMNLSVYPTVVHNWNNLEGMKELAITEPEMLYEAWGAFPVEKKSQAINPMKKWPTAHQAAIEVVCEARGMATRVYNETIGYINGRIKV